MHIPRSAVCFDVLFLLCFLIVFVRKFCFRVPCANSDVDVICTCTCSLDILSIAYIFVYKLLLLVCLMP